jgi:hypothetical protein
MAGVNGVSYRGINGKRLGAQGCYAPFDNAGMAAIDAIHALGVQHVAKFMDEPRTEAEWMAWGYHLHGP